MFFPLRRWRTDGLGRRRRVLTPSSGRQTGAGRPRAAAVARQIYYNPYLDRRVFGFGFRARLKSLLARPLADFEGTCKAPPFK